MPGRALCLLLNPFHFSPSYSAVNVQQLLSMSSSLRNGYNDAYNRYCATAIHTSHATSSLTPARSSYSSDPPGPGNKWLCSSVFGELHKARTWSHHAPVLQLCSCCRCSDQFIPREVTLFIQVTCKTSSPGSLKPKTQ